MQSQPVITEVLSRARVRASSMLPLLVTPRYLSTPLLILYALGFALALGLGSAYLTLSGEPPFGSVQLGSWRAWPKLGSRDADPYMRAIMARRGDVPLATGEGIALTATHDKDGRRLDASCTYRIGSVMPAARLWTLTVYDENGRFLTSELGRSGFTSAEILRDAEDGFTINLSRDLSPGNWLQLPPSGRFTVALRLYDVPGAAGSNLNAESYPVIERVRCGS